MDETLNPYAPGAGTRPPELVGRDQVIEDVWAHGHQESLRDDLRLRAALDRLVVDVKPISVDLAEARDKLWTPDKENTEPEKKLWTPGSKEPQ